MKLMSSSLHSSSLLWSDGPTFCLCFFIVFPPSEFFYYRVLTFGQLPNCYSLLMLFNTRTSKDPETNRSPNTIIGTRAISLRLGVGQLDFQPDGSNSSSNY